jgi:hypothetical protein
MQRPIAIAISSITKNAAVMTIVFDQAVLLNGLPKYTTDLAGVTTLSASLTNPTTLALTFSAAIATATSLNIPIEDAAIRNASGGYANAGTFPV